MSRRRRKINISLLILSGILGVWAAFLYSRPTLVLSREGNMVENSTDTINRPEIESAKSTDDLAVVKSMAATNGTEEPERPQGTERSDRSQGTEMSDRSQEKEAVVAFTRFREADVSRMVADHPFQKEALKVLRGGLDETDSISRRRILSYCEHLRTAYTTRDIDFIRQVFSDNALIIVGHMVKTGKTTSESQSGSSNVRYSLRSKREYLEKLRALFDSGKEIDLKFFDFKIMRHPTLPGIYGVRLRQSYKGGDYSDDGYLFLLWDFRDISMPLIHVRTWQPTDAEGVREEDLIDISDFNLE